MRATRFAAIFALLAASGCGDDSSGPEPSGGPVNATVQFVYAAPTTTDPEVAANFPQCVQGVSVTHIHPSWRGYPAIPLTAVEAERWEISFTDVPVGAEQRIRISDPNTCALNPTGASTEGVSANGTLLTRIVDTPGSGTEPGLGFRVAADGTVAP